MLKRLRTSLFKGGRLDRRSPGFVNLAILVALLAAFLPHMGHLPPWLSLFALVLWGWRALIDIKGYKPPSKWLQLPLVLGGAAAVLLTYGRLLGHDSGVSLFTAMLAIKPLEIRSRRDQSVTLFLGYFLSVTLALFHNNMASILAMLASCLITTTVLGMVHVRSWKPLQALRFAAILFIQAAPLAAVCFVLFPRLPGSLWGVPAQGASAVSGLSDTMSPGSISRLVLSGETAFRVAFDGRTPESDSLYWRALTLWDYDGRTWTEGRNPPLPGILDAKSEPLEYTITLEPHHQTLLPALDMPVEAPFGGRMASGHTIRALSPVFKRVGYELESTLEYGFSELSERVRGRALDIDPDQNPRTWQMVRGWTEQTDVDAQRVDLALDFMRDNGFIYTLQPLPLGAAAVDDFLFRTRQGFCEHYASSFTWMMRAAGVPARVVVGYQGGTYNPAGEYLIVRQSEAHAWSEVWLPGKGWTRVDPTAAVAPRRISEGMEAVAPEVDMLPLFSGFEDTDLYRAWRRFRLQVDALYHTWNQWVLYYDFHRQGRLLQRLGLGRNIWQAFSKVLFLGLGLFLAFMIAMALLLLRRERVERDAAVVQYQRFLVKLRRAGVVPALHEGPLALAERIELEQSDLGETAGRICRLYARLRYGPTSDADMLSKLRAEVRAFSPRIRKEP